MFKPLSLYIGLRYTRAKRRNRFISFISLMSMVGIMLGVAVLITVLSVMNGFDLRIRQQIFDIAPEVTVKSVMGTTSHWQDLQKRLNKLPHVIASEPYILGQGMVASQGMVQGVAINGIDPKQVTKVSKLKSKVVLGSLDHLKPGAFEIAVGRDLADTLGLNIGSKLMVITPIAAMTPVGLVPRYKRFTVGAIFHASSGFGFDSSLAFINIQDAQALFNMPDRVTGVRLKINKPLDAPLFADSIMADLPHNYIVTTWAQDYGALFHAIALEKNMMFLIMLLIVMVAAFNLVSSLVMTVNEKRAEIAILRTMGATPKTILRIFVIQGALIGFIGTALGVIGGVVLALNVTSVVNWIQTAFRVQLISPSVYALDYLPSQIMPSDIIHIVIFAVALSLVATLYPAWRASKTQPAEALRYE